MEIAWLTRSGRRRRQRARREDARRGCGRSARRDAPAVSRRAARSAWNSTRVDRAIGAVDVEAGKPPTYGA